MPCIRITAVDCHIGSQIIQMAPLREALHRMLSRWIGWQGRHPMTISMPAADSASCYRDEAPPPLEEYRAGAPRVLAGREEMLILEPDAHWLANAGVLLTRVEYLKQGRPELRDCRCGNERSAATGSL